jgi:uncharacterized protein (TIGR02145 family)
MKKRAGIFTILFVFTCFSFLTCEKDKEPESMTNKLEFSKIQVDSVSYREAKISYELENLDKNELQSFGVCYDTSNKPTTEGNTVSLSTDSSSNKTIDNLNPDTEYHFRLYAEIGDATVYSNDKLFSTNPLGTPVIVTGEITDTSATSAVCEGNVTDNNGSDVTAKGVCWNISQNPTINDNYTSEAGGKGSFNSEIIGLTEGTTYYVRAYATNEVGTAYGEELSFKTEDGLPELTTSEVTDIDTNSATTGGNITDNGGFSINDRGVCWSTSQNPTINDNSTSDGTGTGSFTSELTGLTEGTTYYVRAYAINEVDTAYGGEKEFSTGMNPVADFSADTTKIQLGNSVQFTDESTGSPTSWSWDFGDGETSSKAKPSHTYSSKGTYTVELTVSNGYGSDKETKTDYISVGSSPTANFSADATTITEGETVNFTDQSTNDPTSWSWDFGDGETSSEANPFHTYSSEGTYTVELTVTNEYGSDTETKTDYITVEIQCPSSFTDSRDGQTYNVVQIGDQCWMAENLNYNVDSSWGYDNNSSNCDTYGRLYEWDAVMQGESSSNSNPSGVQGVCPDGWHVPSDEEWKELEMQLGMSQSEADNTGYRGTNEGSKLAGNASLWVSGSLTSDSEFGTSGFTALPGGDRDGGGGFDYIGSYGGWWSSTENSSADAWYRTMIFSRPGVNRGGYAKEYGFSVRCVKDD